MKLPQLPGYRYLELLGEGPCGWVFRCTWNGTEERAVKVLKSQATNRPLVAGCLRAQGNGEVRHTAFAEIYHSDLSGRPLAFAMPLFGSRDPSTGRWNSQSLENYCGVLPPDDSIVLIDQMADAMSCLHRSGVFHVGLKPSNLFVTGDRENGYKLKISDIGQGYTAGVHYLEMGDAGFYSSIEQLETGDLTGGHGPQWDVYSFGVVAYQLITGRLPRLDSRFEQYKQNPASISQMVGLAHGELFDGAETFIKWLKLESTIKWPDQPQSEKEASRRFVIEKCLALDPIERFTDMRQVSEALLQSDHQLEINRLRLAEQAALKKGSGGKARLWKAAAMLFLTLFLAALAACGVLYGMNELTKSRQETMLSKVQMTAQEAEDAAKQALADRDNFEVEMQKTLENAEVSKEQLLGQASLARQLLRQIQANGDRFFELALENRDSDVPGYELDRARALVEARKYYETLIGVYDGAPEFGLSLADAHRYLAEICYETGEFQKSKESLIDSIGYYEGLYKVDQNNLGVIRGLARVHQLQGAVSVKVGTPQRTLEALDASNRYLQSFVEKDPSKSFEATLGIAENLYHIATTYQQAGDAKNALNFAKASGDTYISLQPANPGNDKVLAGVARSFGITGELLLKQGSSKEAGAAFQQSADVYAEAIQKNGAVDDYQLGLGKAMGQIGLISQDTKKLEAAAAVLAEVVPANPFKSEYQKILAEVLGVLSDQQRNGGQEANAIELAQKAVTILRPIIDAGNAVPQDVQFVYAQRLASLAKLQGDSGKFAESRIPLGQSIEILEQLSKVDVSNSQYRRTLAHAQGLAGFASAEAGEKTEAKVHYQVAQTELENYVALFPDDEDAKAEAKWVKEQLARL